MVTYLLQIITRKTLPNHSPTQPVYHRDPSYTHIHVFDYLYYPLLLSTTINKLQPRSTMCVFLGYPFNHRGYKCVYLSHEKITISLHVFSYETQIPFVWLSCTLTPTYDCFIDVLNLYIIHQWTHPSSQSPPDNLFGESHIHDPHQISPTPQPLPFPPLWITWIPLPLLHHRPNPHFLPESWPLVTWLMFTNPENSLTRM